MPKTALPNATIMGYVQAMMLHRPWEVAFSLVMRVIQGAGVASIAMMHWASSDGAGVK